MFWASTNSVRLLKNQEKCGGEVRFLVALFYSAIEHLHVFRYEDD